MPKLILSLWFLGIAQPAWSQQVCIYRDFKGQTVIVDSEAKIPDDLRESARCRKNTRSAQPLAAPEQIQLQGSVRSENMVSSVGRIKLRWPRNVERLFGRTPQRAMVDAARTVGRALKHSGFPSDIQKLDIDWSVVFMDEEMSESQIPTYLINSCHPGWMMPPANIYIVAQRVASGCGNRKTSQTGVADSELAQVLIHEMGHVVEYQILRETFFKDRARAEGFATWFESFASEYSDLIRRRQIRENQLSLAKALYRSNFDNKQFTGSAEDYIRASLAFHAIFDRRSVSGIMQVYQVLLQEQDADLYRGIQRALAWNRRRLDNEIERLLR